MKSRKEFCGHLFPVTASAPVLFTKMSIQTSSALRTKVYFATKAMRQAPGQHQTDIQKAERLVKAPITRPMWRSRRVHPCRNRPKPPETGQTQANGTSQEIHYKRLLQPKAAARSKRSERLLRAQSSHSQFHSPSIIIAVVYTRWVMCTRVLEALEALRTAVRD